jgi:hypothetical protein
VRQKRERGTVLVFAVILIVIVLAFTALSVEMVKRQALSLETHQEVFAARQIAESAAAQALTRMRESSLLEPQSGGGSQPAWVNFGNGQFLYKTVFDSTTYTSRIRAWGRLAVGASASGSAVAPDDSTWDGSGWLVRGIEIAIKNGKRLPKAPLYSGNGAIERPLGGFEFTSGTDITDPSTWTYVTSGPASYQAASIPFEVNALSHPQDYLWLDTDSDGLIDYLDPDDDNDGVVDAVADAFIAPDPPSGFPHRFPVWSGQNPVAQCNLEAWFENSAGAGNDPKLKVTPAVQDWYETSDKTADGYPFPVDANAPDVQSYTEELWNTYQDDPLATKLAQGAHSGTYGTLQSPAVTFVTGTLTVNAGTTFEGAGVLVIRDDYDPNDPNASNTPSVKASLVVNGTLRWTGLVLVAGWAPAIQTGTGSDTTIVGSIYGEDSVMSGGETSLDSATISYVINGPFRLKWSNALFAYGGPVHELLPFVLKEIVGIRELDVPGSGSGSG